MRHQSYLIQGKDNLLELFQHGNLLATFKDVVIEGGSESIAIEMV